MWKIVFAVVLVVSTAQAAQQATAYDALVTVGNQFSHAALKHLISVTGTHGDPQPTQWTILITDRKAPGGVREIQVADGRIVSNQAASGHVTGSAEGATINTAQLNLDSDGAFTVANYTADRSHT
ncbi:MAG: hypothetical protein ABI992_11840, partial [Chthoniobacterales bacterium]